MPGSYTCSRQCSDGLYNKIALVLKPHSQGVKLPYLPLPHYCKWLLYEGGPDTGKLKAGSTKPKPLLSKRRNMRRNVCQWMVHNSSLTAEISIARKQLVWCFPVAYKTHLRKASFPLPSFYCTVQSTFRRDSEWT